MKQVLGKNGTVMAVELTRAEWKAKPKDYKTGRLGKNGKVMTMDTDGATALVTAILVD
jgi:hypothetical protein